MLTLDIVNDNVGTAMIVRAIGLLVHCETDIRSSQRLKLARSLLSCSTQNVSRLYHLYSQQPISYLKSHRESLRLALPTYHFVYNFKQRARVVYRNASRESTKAVISREAGSNCFDFLDFTKS